MRHSDGAMFVLWELMMTRCIIIAKPVMPAILMFAWIVTRLEVVVWTSTTG